MFLICTRNFPPDIGGIQNLMEGLSLALLDHGPVKVFADGFISHDNYDKNSKLNIERISGLKIFRKYRKANQIKYFVENNNVRALFFDHWKSIEKINQKILDKNTSFCLIHSKEINHISGTALNKRMIASLNKAKFVIANSNYTKSLVIKNGYIKDNIKIIHPGCNYPIQIDKSFDLKAKDLFKDSFPKIITVARLDKRKNHQNVLMTIKNLKPKFPNIKYISVGGGEEQNNLLSLKKELSLDKDVLFLENVEESLKIALLKESDLFLMPSIIYKKSVEGFGISYIEAASYGKPSIAGCSGGEKDAVVDCETGYICDGENLSSIYETVIRSLEKENYLKLGKNAFDFSKEFQWKKLIKKYLELI